MAVGWWRLRQQGGRWHQNAATGCWLPLASRIRLASNRGNRIRAPDRYQQQAVPRWPPFPPSLTRCGCCPAVSLCGELQRVELGSATGQQRACRVLPPAPATALCSCAATGLDLPARLALAPQAPWRTSCRARSGGWQHGCRGRHPLRPTSPCWAACALLTRRGCWRLPASWRSSSRFAVAEGQDDLCILWGVMRLPGIALPPSPAARFCLCCTHLPAFPLCPPVALPHSL
jgi:hypothetical protein